MFAQTAVILLARPFTQAELERALAAHPRRGEGTAPPFHDAPLEGAAHLAELGLWMRGDARVALRVPTDARASITVSAFSAPWPDGMGDPKDEVALFGAWATRWFGLGTTPYALARALLAAGALRERVSEHAAFLRLQLHYLADAGPDTPVFPVDRRIPGELAALARVAGDLLGDTRARAWFVPGADLVLPAEQALSLAVEQARGALQYPLWVSIRENGAGRALLETVGLAALGRPDHQLLIDDDQVEPARAFELLGQLLAHPRDDGAPAEMLGAGARWFPVELDDEGVPPRALVRWSTHEDALPDRVDELSEAHAGALQAHLEGLLGPVDMVWHELVSDRVHLDVLLFRARGTRRHHVLVTQGMSARAMAAPEGAEELRFAELVLALPDSWPVDDAALQRPEHYWPIGQLKLAARLPHAYDTWLGWGHTIPNGDPAEPYAEGTSLCCALVGAPATFPEAAASLTRDDGATLRLWGLYFIHRDEMQKKLATGAEALFAQLGARRVTELLEPKRPSAYKKRFWLV